TLMLLGLTALGPGYLLGVNLVVCGALAVAAVAKVYVIATWIAERMFEHRMRAALKLAGDVHADLDRLATGPLDVARGLVRSVDGWAIGLTLAGAIAVAVLLGFVTFVIGGYSGSFGLRSFWVSRQPIADNAGLLLVALAVGVGFASAVGRACDREHRRPVA